MMSPMKNPKLVQAGLLCLTLSCMSIASHADDTKADVDVAAQVNRLLQQYGIPGAAVLLIHHQKVDELVFGYSDAEQHIPVTRNTLFELGSVTKTMTALLLARQVNAGTLRFDQSWTGLMPAAAKYSAAMQNISLLNLATYTSSLPKDVTGLPYNAATSAAGERRLEQFEARWQPGFPVGSHSLYSNLGFSLLAQGLASQQGKSLDTLMRAQIFAPLHMQDTTLDLAPQSPAYSRYAQGYTSDDKPARTPAAGMLPGAWAAKATIADMRGFLQAAIGDPSTAPDLLQAMRVTETGYFQRSHAENGARIGLAWTILPLSKVTAADWHSPPPTRTTKKTAPGGPDREVILIAQPRFDADCLIDKTGSTDGFRAYIGVIPSADTGIVILTNKFTYNYGALRDLGRGLLLQTAGLAKPDSPHAARRRR